MKIIPKKDQQPSDQFLKVLVYGQSGSGKTTFASTFPNALYVDLEKGLGNKTVEARVVIENYRDFKLLIDSSKTIANRFDTIVIDSLNELVEVVVRDVILGFDVKRMYEDQLTMSDYGKIAREINALVRLLISELNDLYHLVFTCAEMPRLSQEDQRQPSLTGKVLLETLPRLMDVVGCIFTAKGGHFMTISNSSFAVGKNRYGVNDTPFPPTFDELMKKISNKDNK